MVILNDCFMRFVKVMFSDRNGSVLYEIAFSLCYDGFNLIVMNILQFYLETFPSLPMVKIVKRKIPSL